MQHQIDLHPASLLRLPDDYSKGIFECLQLDDRINLAETCDHFNSIADDHIFKNYSTFEINQSNYKGIEYIRAYIGSHVTSLTIDCSKVDPSWSLGKVLADFTNVKCLRVRIANCPGDSYQDDLSQCNFDKVETLTLAYCNLNFAKSFLQNFHKLKCLKILATDFRPSDLESVFRNSSNIESFIFCCSGRGGTDFEFDYRLVQMIPNVRRLSISVADDLHMNYLANLNQLTKLQINCQWLSLNDALRDLARNGILEDIQLLNAHIDDDLFDILKSFDKLQSVEITTGSSSTPDSTMPWPSNWPSKLKKLRLAGTHISRTDFLATIEDLKLLEIIDVGHSDISDVPAYDKSDFNHAAELAKEICHSVLNGGRRERLDVILPVDLNLKNRVSVAVNLRDFPA